MIGLFLSGLRGGSKESHPVVAECLHFQLVSASTLCLFLLLPPLTLEPASSGLPGGTEDRFLSRNLAGRQLRTGEPPASRAEPLPVLGLSLTSVQTAIVLPPSQYLENTMTNLLCNLHTHFDDFLPLENADCT